MRRIERLVESASSMFSIPRRGSIPTAPTISPFIPRNLAKTFPARRNALLLGSLRLLALVIAPLIGWLCHGMSDRLVRDLNDSSQSRTFACGLESRQAASSKRLHRAQAS